MPLFAGAAMAAGLTPVLVAIALLFPAQRFIAEAVAISLPLLAAMGQFEQATGGFRLLSVSGVLAIMFMMLTFQVYACTWMDGLLPRRRMSFVSTAESRLTPDRLFPHLAQTPDTDPAMRSPDMLSIEWIEPGRQYRMVQRRGDLGQIVEVKTLRAFHAPHHLANDFHAPDARPGTAGASGSFELTFSPSPHGTRLIARRSFDNSNWRFRILAWIDDSFGRFDDGYISIAESRESAILSKA